jgi:hypothetical protein
MSIEAVWQRWRDLTRFRLACEMALSAYEKGFSELPIRGIRSAMIYDEKGPTKFECKYDDFKNALKDVTLLYQLLLVAHASLVEEFGRAIVASLINSGIAKKSEFPGFDAALPVEEAVEAYILKSNVESWGAALLKLADRDWSIVPGNVRDVVHAFVVRNIVAHGAKAYGQTALNRLNGLAGEAISISVGDAFVLDRESFQVHLSRLRNFARVICGVPARAQKLRVISSDKAPSKGKLKKNTQ